MNICAQDKPTAADGRPTHLSALGRLDISYDRMPDVHLHYDARARCMKPSTGDCLLIILEAVSPDMPSVSFEGQTIPPKVSRSFRHVVFKSLRAFPFRDV